MEVELCISLRYFDSRSVGSVNKCPTFRRKKRFCRYSAGNCRSNSEDVFPHLGWASCWEGLYKMISAPSNQRTLDHLIFSFYNIHRPARILNTCLNSQNFIIFPSECHLYSVVRSLIIDPSRPRKGGISFAKLVNRDVQERDWLLEAAQKDKTFYLDLLEGESEELSEKYEKCLAIVAAWFEKPLEEKAQDASTLMSTGKL